MVRMDDLIAKRDHLLKAVLHEELIKHNVPPRDAERALDDGFIRIEERWKSDLKERHQDLAKALKQEIKL